MFKKDIDVITIFEYPTISSFLGYLMQREKGDNSREQEIEEFDLVQDEAADLMKQTINLIEEESEE
jgi:hypothetical protein